MPAPAHHPCWKLNKVSRTVLDNEELLSAPDFRIIFSELIKNAQNVQIISAYIKVNAVDWFVGNGNPKVSLVTRFNPSDILSNATDFDALRKSLELGWDVYVHPKLHSKIYCIDKNILFIGSANFTTSGLNIYDKGNQETLCKKIYMQSDEAYLSDIYRASYKLTSDMLEKMEVYLGTLESSDLNSIQLWPNHIIEQEKLLLVTDFPFVKPGEYCSEYEDNSKYTFAYIETWLNDPIKKKEYLKNTKSYRWLISTLNNVEEKQIYYGNLTKLLHDGLDEDPKPYRKDIKVLLSNLLAYVEYYAKDEIELSRPNYSQLIKIIRSQ